MGLDLIFIRPEWFLGVLPVLWFLWKAWQIKANQGRWQKVIEPKFQTLLLGRGYKAQNQTNMHLSLVALAVIWLLAIIALAGPSLKSVQIPAEKTQQGTVILLDLSLSMLANDLMPNRISRARFKLIDLLKKHPEHSVGLIGYAASAHSIAPISEDNSTLLALLPELNPLIMPEYGSHPLEAMKLAEKMFQASQINQGHLIWVTDDVEPAQSKAIQSWLNRRNISLSILAVGTQAGGTVTIPNVGLLRDANDQIIIPKLPYPTLQTLSRATGAALTPLQVDDSDLMLLIPSNLAAVADQEQQADKKEVLHRLDDGAALVILLIPLLAFAYRRGWLFSVFLLLFLPLGSVYTPPSYAQQTEQTAATKTQLPEFKEVFETADQQAYKAFQNNDLQAAEALFESSQWKGSTLYRLEKYAEAAKQFKKDPSAKGHYNLGNSLAKQGKLKEAKQAYEKALVLQPDFKDAQSNLALIKEILEQQKTTQDGASGQTNDKGSGQAQSKDNQKIEPQKPSDHQNAPDTNQPQVSDSDSEALAPPEQNNQTAQQTTDNANKGEAKQQQKDKKEQAASAQLNGESGKNGQQADPENTSQGQDPSNNIDPNLDAVNTDKPDQQNAQSQALSANKDTDNQANDKPDDQTDSNQTGDSKNPTQQDKTDSAPSKEAQSNDDLGKDVTQTEQDKNSLKQQEQQRATDNWLRQIPDQPGLFLKRKFEYQYQQNNPRNSSRNNSKGAQTPSQKAAEKIW